MGAVPLVVTLKPGAVDIQSASTATVAASSVVNELVVMSFGYYNPLDIRQGADEQQATVEARMFAQIALPRSAFAQWIEQTLLMIAKLEDKDTFGWQKLVAALRPESK